MEYHRLLTRGAPGPWRPVVGLLLLAIAFVLVVPVVSYSVFAGLVDDPATVLDTDVLTPWGLAYVNATIAAMIPVTWLLVRAVHGVRPRWLASVRPRIRWGWLGLCLVLSVAALLGTVLLSAFVPASAETTEVSTTLNDFTTTTRDFLLVIVLLTPLQAVGEEYVFRGYLTQAFGSLWSSPYVAVLGPALLFALAHGAQSLPVFIDRLAFGIVSGVLVIRTGGLEAGIAMHVLNNFLAFGLLLAFGDMASALDPPEGSWWGVLVTVVRSVGFVVLVLVVARAIGLQTRTTQPVLEAPAGPV